jgi:hypothetical protein
VATTLHFHPVYRGHSKQLSHRAGQTPPSTMTLKIERSAQQGFTVLTLSGHIEAEHIAALLELPEFQADSRKVILDLQEIRLADRYAVGFLRGCETKGIKLRNCPAYIREWMEREKG